MKTFILVTKIQINVNNDINKIYYYIRVYLMVKVLCYGHKLYKFESYTRFMIKFIETCCKRFYVLIANQVLEVPFLRDSYTGFKLNAL